MQAGTIGKILWRAAADEDFRNRTIENLGIALAQEGFLVTDGEMAQLRGWWEELQSLSSRRAAERIQALARAYRT